jgi:hypothetical protein
MSHLGRSPRRIARRACGFVAVLVSVTAVGGIGASAAPAFDSSYCGDRYTAAHGSCWFSDVGGGNHSWIANHATYSGTGSFDICAAIDYYPHSSPSLISRCTPNKATGTDAFVSYCGSDQQVANKDAGVGNTDGNRHHIAGYATTSGC